MQLDFYLHFQNAENFALSTSNSCFILTLTGEKLNEQTNISLVN